MKKNGNYLWCLAVEGHYNFDHYMPDLNSIVLEKLKGGVLPDHKEFSWNSLLNHNAYFI